MFYMVVVICFILFLWSVDILLFSADETFEKNQKRYYSTSFGNKKNDINLS